MFRLTSEAHDYQAVREREGMSFISVINIGCDDDRLKVYSIEIGLIPQPGGGTEFYFTIVEADDDTGAVYRHWSGKDVGSFLGTRERQAVLGVVLAETRWVLENIRPHAVQCVTFDESPPTKALHKHRLIVGVFESCGYKVQQLKRWHGRRAWQMDLPQSCYR